MALLLNSGRTLLFFAFAAVLHELGHLLMLRLLNGKIRQIRFRLSGAEILYSGCHLSYRNEILVALAGPGVNFLCAFLTALAAQRLASAQLYLFVGCHLVLGLFNLIPAMPLDGGRALKALLEMSFPLYGERMTEWISGVSGLFLLMMGALFLDKTGNISLISASCVILFHSATKWSLHRGEKELK